MEWTVHYFETPDKFLYGVKIEGYSLKFIRDWRYNLMSTSIEREYYLIIGIATAIAIILGALGKFYIAYGKYKISCAKAYCIKKSAHYKK
ncbi:hypothetical protein F4V47_03350 [Lactococcus garvieae subsp. garvieae]|nr:hypothetical protein F4V47_03350 [Lactococcus garvieae subsp. garvieae]